MDHVKYTWVLTMVVACAVLIAGPARAIEIISPVDGSVVVKTTRLVIKGGDQPVLDAIVISVNGEKSDLLDISSAAYRQSFRDFVFLEAGYDSGVNNIEVEGYAKGKRVSAVKIKVYAPDGLMAPPAPFAIKKFHVAEQEARCAGCHHNLDPDAKMMASPVPGQNPCSTCHANIVAGKYAHGPAGVFDCMVCHDPKSRPVKYVLADDLGHFCGECHEDVLADVKKAKFIHGPVEAGLCLTCHDPHSSPVPELLRESTVNISCLQCHEQVAKADVHVIRTVTGSGHVLEGPKNPAKPQKPFNCASCHDPHGGSNKVFLRGDTAQGFNFCKYCHTK